MKRRSKRAMAMSVLMLGSAFSPLSSVVVHAAEGNWIESEKVDVDNFKNTTEGRKQEAWVEIDKGGVTSPSVPHVVTIKNVIPSDKAKITTFGNVPQLFNQNFGDKNLIERTKTGPDPWTTLGPFTPEEYKREVTGKVDDYGGSGFPKKFSSLSKTIYNRFRAGYRGTNINIPAEVVHNNKDMEIEFKYPGGAKVYERIYNPKTNHYDCKVKKVDVYMTLSGFVYRMAANEWKNDQYVDVPVDINHPENWQIGNAGDPHREGDRNNFDLMISSSYNPMSGFRPKNIESMKLKIEFKDGNKPVDAGFAKKQGFQDPKVYFTFGSLNFYGDTAEAVGILNPPSGTKAYLSKDSHLVQRAYVPSLKKTTHSTYFKYDAMENDFASDNSRWGTRNHMSDVYANKAVFVADSELGKEANNFDDFLESKNYQKNAVTFAVPASNSYEFLLGVHSFAGVGDLATSVWTGKQYTRLPWGGSNGWQFVSSAPIFKPASNIIPPKRNDGEEPPPHINPYAPVKTVTDENETEVYRNRIGKNEGKTIVYRINQRVHSIGGGRTAPYKSFKIEDTLPEGVTFVNAKVYMGGEEFTNAGAISYDDASRTVKWEAGPDQLGEEAEREGVRYHNPGSMPMEGEIYTLAITVRVNEGHNRVIKNRATTYIDGEAVSSNETETNPNPTPELQIKKTVTTPSGTNKRETNPDDKTDNVRDTVLGEDNIYTIYSDIPEDIETYNLYKIKDTLSNQLTFTPGSLSLKLLDEGNNEVEYSKFHQTLENNVLTVEPQDKLAMRGYKKLKISFKAKLNENTVPDQQVSNSATIDYQNVNGEHGEGKTSNSVNIFSERAEDPTIVKDVMGHPDEYFAEKAGKPFEYHLESRLPKNIHKYSQLMISDSLDKRLKIVNKNGKEDIKVETISNTGETREYTGYQVDHNKNTNKLNITFTDFAGLKNQSKLKVTINSMVDASVKTDERIPNTASISYTSPNATMKTRETKQPVYVWINPSDEPLISKTINEEKNAKMMVGREFEYTIPVTLPSNIETYKYIDVKDKLDERIDYVENSARTLVDGDEANWINPSYDEATRTVKYRIEDTARLRGKHKVTLKIKTKLNAKARYNSEVPNVANLEFKNATMEEPKKKETPPTIVVPQLDDTSLEITKTINSDQENYKVKKGVPFTYNLKIKLPQFAYQYKQFIVEDKLDRRLDYVNFESVDLDGVSVISNKDLANPAKDLVDDKNNPISYDSHTRLLKFEIPKEKMKNLKDAKTLTINFKAKANVDDEAIPNKATARVTDGFDVHKDIDSNVTTTTSKPKDGIDPNFVLDKLVNNKKTLEAKKGEEFTYSLNTTLPDNIRTYRNLTFADELDNRLSFVGNEVKITSHDKAVPTADYNVKFERQKLSVEFTNLSHLDKDVKISFNAKLNKELDNGESVGNVYTLTPTDENGKVENKESSPEAKVEKPNKEGDANQFVLEKTVNDKSKTVAKKGEMFTYKLNTKLPQNIKEYKSLTIKDKLDERLAFANNNVTLESNKRELNRNDYSVNINGQDLNVTIRNMQAIEGNLVVKFNANLTRELKKNEKVPNVYSVIATDSTGKEVPTSSSNETDVETPNDTKESKDFNLEKSINGKKSIRAKKGDTFTYKLDTSLPSNITRYKELVVEDDLDSRLSLTNKPIRVSTGGKEVKESEYKLLKEGQKLKLTFEKPSILQGDLSVTFDATLNRDIAEDEKVPNVYKINGVDPEDKSIAETSSNEVVIDNSDGKLSANNPNDPNNNPLDLKNKANDPNGPNDPNNNSILNLSQKHPDGINGIQREGDGDQGEALKGEKVKTGEEAKKGLMALGVIGVSSVLAAGYAIMLHRKNKKSS